MEKAAISLTAKNEGPSLSVVGDTYRLVITGRQTNGEFALIDMLVPPGGGPGPHAHPGMHETFYVQEGEIEVKTESGAYTATAGCTIYIPKGGGVHCFKNKSDRMAHLLCYVVPAGLDEFFLEIGQPVAPGVFLPPPTLDAAALNNLRAIAGKYGTTIFPPDFLDR